MSKITIELQRADVCSIGNHFIVVQLDETEFPSKLLKTQKFRTEIEYDTEFPQFFKSSFEFGNVILGNRVVIRIGLFKTSCRESDTPNNILFEYSELIGRNDIVLTSTLTEMLRKHKWVENELPLLDPERINKETGRVFMKIYLKSETIDMKIYDDNTEISECFYDPFESDELIIKEKLKKVIVLNEEKQIKLMKKAEQVNEINRKFKQIALDKVNVLNEISQIEKENDHLRRGLDKLQNYDEIHIEVDILSQSNQGIAMLEKKYAILLSQLGIQKHEHLELNNNYLEIDEIMSKIKLVKEKITKLKMANEELKFHIKRNEDTIPLIVNYKERIKNNEKLILNIQESTQHVIDKNLDKIKTSSFNVNCKEELDKKIKNLYQERQKLEEKVMQLKLFQNLYSQITEDNLLEAQNGFTQIAGLDPIINTIVNKGEEELLNNYKNKTLELSEEVHKLNTKLEKINSYEKEIKENTIIIDPNTKYKKRNFTSKIENLISRENALLEELESSRTFYRQSISKIKQRIEEANLKIKNKEKNYNNNYKYD